MKFGKIITRLHVGFTKGHGGNWMFNIGEYVVYGNQGVCKVESIGPIDIFGVSKDKEYYTLVPVYHNESKVYAPVDNNKTVMRPIMSEDAVKGLIARIGDIDTITIVNERGRELIYKEALHKCDCEELVKVMKTIYIRNEQRAREGKKVTSSDERYLKLAEEALYGEFAVVLNINKYEVESYIEANYNGSDN